MPELVTDYEIYSLINGERRLIKTVTGNYQRVNHLNFDKIKATEIEIKLLSTGGSKRFGVYDVMVLNN